MLEDIQKKKNLFRQPTQRLLPKYNNPTYLRLKQKVAKNNDDLIENLGRYYL